MISESPRRVRVAGDLYHGRVPDGAIYVGRPAPGLKAGPFANRHRVGKPCRLCARTHDRADSIATYARDLALRPDLIDAARHDLAGADLACWCPLDVPCHADLLLRVAAGADPLDRTSARPGGAALPDAR